jgi:hypothetical protein
LAEPGHIALVPANTRAPDRLAVEVGVLPDSTRVRAADQPLTKSHKFLLVLGAVATF